MKILRGTVAVLFSLCALIALFFTSLQLSIFDMDYMDAECRKLSTAERLHMEEADLHVLFQETLAYLSDDRDDLVIPTVVDGEPREAFDEQEKLHMVDVKDLFIAGFRIRKYCAIAAAVLLIGCLLIFRGREGLRVLAKSIVLTWGICILALGALIIIVATDFEASFIKFHHIFFHNDLWLMDPETSLMINMVPEEYFFDVAMRIGVFVLVPIVLIMILCAIVWAWLARRRRSGVEV